MFRSLVLFMLVLGSLGHTVLGQETKGLSGNQSILNRDRAQVLKRHPRLDVDLLLRFYQEYSPDLLVEWRRRSVERPEQSGEYFGRLAAHFLELESIRQTDLNEYNRLLEYEIMQGKIRTLSREIQRLVRMEQELLSQETEALRVESLTQAKASLMDLLERSFDESLRQQLREIDRLEREVRLLREGAEERKSGRRQFIEERFRRLTGGASVN